MEVQNNTSSTTTNVGLAQ